MLIRHSAIYLGAKLLPGALGMLTTALLTRLLPPERYGVYGVTLVIMSFGATIVFDWLGLAYLRLARSQPDRALACSTFNRLFAAMLGLIALLGIGAAALAAPGDRPTVLAGVLLMASYARFEFRARLPVADLLPGAYLRMNLTRAALILVAAGATASLTRDPIWTAIATALATLAASFAGGATPPGAGFDRVLAGSVLAFGLPLALSLALSSAAGSLTRAMVGALDGLEALGLYTAAFLLVQNTLAVLSSGFASAGFALAVHALETGDAAEARRQLAANGALLLAVLAPAALGMALAADSLAATLVGPAFRGAVAQLTPWLAAAALLTGIRAHYLDHAFQLGRTLRGQVWVTASSAVTTLGLGALLIPRMGPRGAAIAVTAGSLVGVVHAAIAGRSAFAMPLPVAQAVRIGGACGVMALCVVAVPGVGPVALAAKMVVGMLAYAMAAVMLDVIGLRGTVLRQAGLIAGRPA